MGRIPHEEREHQILNSSATLFLHFGYDKTTIDEIARAAGISKGAVYLHYKGKEELFGALILREMSVFSQGWFTATQEDPLGGTLGGMYRAMLRGLHSSAFISGVLRRDPSLLGNYVKKPGNMLERGGSGGMTRHEVVVLLQNAGAVRDDMDAKVVAHLLNMISYGMVSLDGLIPRADVPPLDDLVEGIAEIMDRALTPRARHKASRAGKIVLKSAFEVAHAQLQGASPSQPASSKS